MFPEFWLLGPWRRKTEKESEEIFGEGKYIFLRRKGKEENVWGWKTYFFCEGDLSLFISFLILSELQWAASLFKFTPKLSPENVNANSLSSLNPFNFIGYRKMIIHYPKELPLNATYHSWVNVTIIIEPNSSFEANYWGG